MGNNVLANVNVFGDSLWG